MKVGDLITLIEDLTWSDGVISTRYILLRVTSLNGGMPLCDTIPARLDRRKLMLNLLNPDQSDRRWLPGDVRDMPFEAFRVALALT